MAYLLPLALAFPPLLAFGGKAFGWPGGWISTRVALALSIGIFVCLRLTQRDFSMRRIPGLCIMAPYALLVVASVVWGVLGPGSEDALNIAREFMSWLVFGAIIIAVAGSRQSERDLRVAGRVLVAVALTQVVYSLFQGLALIGQGAVVPEPIVALTQAVREETTFGALRLYGTLPNLGPNFFGAFLLVPTVLALSRAFSHRGIRRWLYLFAGGACAVLIGLTYSRGAMFGLVIALLMIPVWRRSWRGAITMIGAVGAVAFLVAQTPVGEHVSELYNAGQLDPSGNARVYLWKAIYTSAAEHPIGLGFNGWPRASEHDPNVGFADLAYTIGSEHPAENQWMRELADRGVFGVLALALLVGGVIRLTYRGVASVVAGSWRADVLVAVGASYVGWAFVFLTGDHLMYDSVAGMFWYTTALALAALRHDEQY